MEGWGFVGSGVALCRLVEAPGGDGRGPLRVGCVRVERGLFVYERPGGFRYAREVERCVERLAHELSERGERLLLQVLGAKTSGARAVAKHAF